MLVLICFDLGDIFPPPPECGQSWLISYIYFYVIYVAVVAVAVLDISVGNNIIIFFWIVK